jgi:hypothetical protein
METELVSEMPCFSKKVDYGQVPKMCSVLLGFLTLEDGIDRFSWNVNNELPLCVA